MSLSFDAPGLAARDDTRLVEGFLRGAHLFSAVVRQVLEDRFLAEVSEERLSFPHLNVLKLLRRRSLHHVGDVARFLGVSYPAASKIVDRLLREALITRRVDPDDRRAACLELAPAGEALIERYEARKRDEVRALLGSLPPEWVGRLGPLLEDLAARLIERAGGDVRVCTRCGAYYPGACAFETTTTCVHADHSA